MTTLLEGARSFATRGTDLGARIEGLERAVEAARGRLDDALLDDAAGTVQRAAGRVRLSAQHTVVAIAGATGSGKSSTFNALTGIELSSTGVRRPTTSWATACVWGSEGAGELLEWLGIPARHQTMRDSMLDSGRDRHALEGVVLLDLPDHDSTEVSHHLEVDRLVQLADLLVWVLDPQKYADAAIHDRYLAPLAEHAGVMLVVLNHIDTVPADRRQAMVDDVQRLLRADGLDDVRVVPISAREDIGVDDLLAEIAARVEAKRDTRERITTDLRGVAARLQGEGGEGRTRDVPEPRVAELEAALAEAAGVPSVIAAHERVDRSRALRATAWPPAAWLGVGRDRSEVPEGLEGLRAGGTGASATGVQRARVDAELRAAADDLSDGLARPWAEGVRAAALARRDELADGLEAATARAAAADSRLPGWAQALRAVQWLLLLGVLGGVAGFVVQVVQGAAVGDPLAVTALGVAGGSLVLGLVLWVVSRSSARRSAAARAEAAAADLRRAVHDLTASLVVAPVTAELQRYSAFRTGLAAASS